MSAPPYKGEGAHALWHVSEDSSIVRFEPRDGRVWAIDTRLPDATFEQEDRYWISLVAVEPTQCVELTDLLELHAAAEIELRIAPKLIELWDRVTASTLDFSGIRLRNATLAR